MSRTYAGRSAADRAAERRTRLLEAGIDVVGTAGVAGFGMREVCRRAGLSQKFFYESFPDPDTLLHEVYATALTRLQEATAPAATDLADTFDAAARLLEADPRICRILLVEPVADARLRAHVRDVVPAIGQALLGPLDGSVDDPLLRMRYSAMFGAILSLFIEWTEGTLGTDRDAFVRHITAVTRHLAAGVPIPAD